MSVTYDFTGRTAIVTGGAKGIGAAITERLRSSGARVWVFDVTAPAGDPYGRVVDVTNAAQIAAAIADVVADTGRIDILINNAGFTGGTIGIEQLDPVEWRRILDVNLTGVFEVSRLAVPHMRRNDYGRVVNIASLAGKEGTPFIAAYATAKAGVIAFTKAFGKELASTGIRVNAIAPAAIDTELLKQMSAESVAGMIAKSPQGRLGKIPEVVEMVLWLASDACTFNTGAVFDLSGGRASY